MTQLKHDWLKAAAAVATNEDSQEEVEKAFADQAYAQAQLTLKPLLQPPFRIGFEIVYSNAPENTKLVGVMAFKVGDEILLVPSCFINGKVCGQELIYREKRKKIVPKNEGWAKYLISRIGTGESGRAVDKFYTRQHPARADMARLHAPGSSRKMASSESAAVRRVAQEMFDVLGSPVKLASVFEELIDGLEGTPAAKKLIQSVELAAEKSAAFAEAAYGTSFEDRLIASARLYLDAAEKSASVAAAPATSGFIIESSTKLASADDAQRTAYFRDGYLLRDTREKKAYTDMTLVDGDVDCNFLQVGTEIQETNSPGLYEIVTDDGSSLALVMRPDLELQASCVVPSQLATYTDGRVNVLAVTDDGQLIRGAGLGYSYGSSRGVDGPEPVAAEKLETGKIYLVAIGGSCTEPLILRDKSVLDDGLVRLDFADVYGDSVSTDSHHVDRSVRFNPDANSRPTYGVLGDDAKFFELKSETDGDQKTIKILRQASRTEIDDALISGHIEIRGIGAKSAGTYRFKFHDDFGIEFRGKQKAAAYLAVSLGVPPTQAQDYIAGLADGHPRGFVVKNAAAIYQGMEPVWHQSFDPSINMQTEETRNFEIPAIQQRVEQPQALLGDEWDPVQGREMLTSKSPMELYQFAHDNGIEQLMDHGAVGELIKTYDVGSLMDKMLVRLEDALDALGRMYFLILWKPEDFKAMFGDGDIDRKEAEFLANFKSLGDTVLDLSKRSREVEANAQREKELIRA